MPSGTECLISPSRASTSEVVFRPNRRPRWSPKNGLKRRPVNMGLCWHIVRVFLLSGPRADPMMARTSTRASVDSRQRRTRRSWASDTGSPIPYRITNHLILAYDDPHLSVLCTVWTCHSIINPPQSGAGVPGSKEGALHSEHPTVVFLAALSANGPLKPIVSNIPIQ